MRTWGRAASWRLLLRGRLRCFRGFRGCGARCQIISAISSMRGSLAPRVVMAGGVARMPEVWKGLRESEGNHVFVGGDVGEHEGFFRLPACEFGEFAAEVYEDAVVVGAAGDDVIAHFDECASEGGGVFLHPGADIRGIRGRGASPKATALAAMTCSSGPPCTPGNTAESSSCDIIFTTPLGVVFPQGFSKS